MNLVLLGPPASGKGTQAKLISKKFNLYHLTTGDIARDLAKKDKRIRDIINSGKLIPEEEMTMYVLDHLKQEKPNLSGILFEGFPRFISQYEALKHFLKLKGDDIDAVFSLELDQEEAVKRITNRRICEKCGKSWNLVTNPPPGKNCSCGGKLIQRKDDNEASVKTRFKYYKENTKKLIDHLDNKGKLIKVDGSKSIEEIFSELEKHIKKIHE